jgi:hypothetical protein
MNRCPPASLNGLTMKDANTMRFPSIVERRLFAHQLGVSFSPTPRTDNLHR